MNKTLFFTLLIVVFSCSKKKPVEKENIVPVKTVYSITKDSPQYISTIGHIEAYRVVNVMAQAGGQLLETFFNDGDDLFKGQLLYLIDQRPYLADVDKAEGEVEENTANLNYAERYAERSSALVKDQYISKNEFDSLITDVKAKDALLKQSQADYDTAKINLSYTEIYSPIDGRAGENNLRDGNLIQEAYEQTLVTINQLSPIYLVFYINEKDLPMVQRFQVKQGPLSVQATIDDINTETFLGKLSFIDNGIDISTGMIKLKATFENKDKILWPNQYATVKLILETIDDAVLIPTEAVQNSPEGKYVYVIENDDVAKKRDVVVGQIQDHDYIIIKQGLRSGEKVVTDGQLNLTDGIKVSEIGSEDEY